MHLHLLEVFLPLQESEMYSTVQYLIDPAYTQPLGMMWICFPIFSANTKMNGKEGTCPTPWKGLTGFCDKMGDECGMDFHCPGNQKCCFSGCQQICVNTSEVHKKADTKPGQCPKPWLGKEGLCDRRGDMCAKDTDCKGSELCCFNGCQKDCVNPGW